MYLLFVKVYVIVIFSILCYCKSSHLNKMYSFQSIRSLSSFSMAEMSAFGQAERFGPKYSVSNSSYGRIVCITL